MFSTSHTFGNKHIGLITSIYGGFFLLPPANEVWGKVMFLHQFVILFTGGACVVLFWGACVVLFRGGGGMHGFIWGGHAWFYSGGACMVLFRQGACVVLFRGVCMVLFGGHAWLYSGGAWYYLGGAYVVLFGRGVWFYSGGACVFFSVFSDTMRYAQ